MLPGRRNGKIHSQGFDFIFGNKWELDAVTLIKRNNQMSAREIDISHDAPILVTGSAGFLGTQVVGSLLRSGFRHIRCLARPRAG